MFFAEAIIRYVQFWVAVLPNFLTPLLRMVIELLQKPL